MSAPTAAVVRVEKTATDFSTRLQTVTMVG